ncbi:MAG: hypothetical protein OEW19_07505, partial [Acidobacteriota bacterium]|nr:hypothetical protein [Acidobacteriota bacterium]
RDPDPASARDGIDLWFTRPAGATSARLVVDARNTPWSAFLLGAFVAAHGRDTPDWYRALEAEPARAAEMQAFLAREAFLRVSLETEHGWQESGLLWEVGPEVVKRQVIPIDLTAVSGEVVHVRLDAPASFWVVDHVALDTGDEPPFSVRTFVARPPTESASRDAFGRIAAADGRELRLETGDAMELHFDVPPPSPDAARSYLVRSTGWYRIHTPESGEPDTALLGSVMTPGGVARTSAMWMNTALGQSKPAAPAR